MLTFGGMVITSNGDWLVYRKKYRVYINSPHGTVIATPKKGFPGTVVTLTNEPDLGYDFSSYTVQGATLSGNTFVIDHQDVYVTGNFSLHDYTITVTQPSGGTISAPSTAHYGDTVTLISIPSTGYELDYFIVDGQPIEGNTFVMPASDVTITAAYKLATYTISITQVANGTIYASAATAHMGDVITLTSSPASHYALNYYTVDGSQIQGNTFTMPAHDVVVSGAFTAATYTISVTQPKGGTISAPATATYGQTVTITNSPNSGWQFDHYIVNGQAISGNTFTCTGNTIVSAVFTQITYTITVNSGSHGTITAPTTAHYGDTVNITATTDYGWLVDHYTVNGSTISGSSFTMPAANVTIGVTYKEDPNPLGLGPYTIRFQFENESFDPRNRSSAGGQQPWPSTSKWTQRSTSPNVWDFRYINKNWSGMFDGTIHSFGDHSAHGWVHVLGANLGEVTNMYHMLNSPGSIRTMAYFDTSKATNMEAAFAANNYLLSIPKFNTSSATNMSNMIAYDLALTNIPLFNTSRATNVYRMCASIGDCSGAYALYNQMANQANPPSEHAECFFSTGSTADRRKIPQSWGGNAAG